MITIIQSMFIHVYTKNLVLSILKMNAKEQLGLKQLLFFICNKWQMSKQCFLCILTSRYTHSTEITNLNPNLTALWCLAMLMTTNYSIWVKITMDRSATTRQQLSQFEISLLDMLTAIYRSTTLCYCSLSFGRRWRLLIQSHLPR